MTTAARKTPAGFWADLPRPIYALAPMADVTDAVYRRLVARLGKPDVMFTEFVSCDGLSSPGRDNLLIHLMYHPSERPIVAQVFSATPENVYKASQLIEELGFDGIDINMGCPDKNVCKQGAGSALIKSPDLAKEIIHAAQDGGHGLPVSVKTRIGYNAPATGDWVGHLLEAHPAAIILHLRTRKEMSKVPARWDQIHEAVALARGTGTRILGNGDVRDLDHARELADQTGADGIMFGRAVLGNPWLFDRNRKTEDIPVQERIAVAREHARLYEEVFRNRKPFLIMRKYLRAYFAGFPGAKDIRIMLEHINCAADVEDLLNRIQSGLPTGHPLRPKA